MFSSSHLQMRAAFQNREREQKRRRRAVLAFSLALGVTTVAGVTVLADIREVLAFADESAAAFFRADRERVRTVHPAPAHPSPALARPVYAAPVEQSRQQPAARSQPGPSPVAGPADVFRMLTIPASGIEAPRKVDVRREAQPAERTRPARSEPGARPVCVRLCDGYHFPVDYYPAGSDAAGQEAVCNSVCPDSPTRLYYLPSGAEDMSAAYSARDRKSYAALPVALRHTSTRDNACTCRRAVSHEARLSHLTDKTLRPGDAVMTQKGFVFLRGARKFPYRETDFSGLEGAGLGYSQRLRLQAMERASLQHAPRREAPLSAPRTTQTPVPALGPFTVRRWHERAGVEPSGAPAGLGG